MIRVLAAVILWLSAGAAFAQFNQSGTPDGIGQLVPITAPPIGPGSNIWLGPSIGQNGGVAPPPAAQPLRSAVSKALVGQAFVAGLGGTSVQGQGRVRMLTGTAPMTEMRVCYGNWAGAGEAVGPGNLVIESALESDGPLGVAHFLWSGQTTITLTPGQTACSDALLPATLGYTTFPANAAFWFRTGATAVSNVGFPYSNLLSGPGEGAWTGPAFTSQVNATGPMTTPAGGAAASGMITPFAVLGRYTVAMPSLCDLGDSISAGINDTAQTWPQGYYTGNGYVGRAAALLGGAEIYPTFKLGIGGDGASSSFTQRATFFQYCTHGVVAEGTNDISGGAAPATVLANLEGMWNAMASAGIGSIWQALLIPRTTSTDGWATEVNQTPITNFGNGGNRDILNTSITAAIGTNHLTGTLDFSSVVQATDNHTLWAVPSITGDGIHPLGPAHGLMAPILQTAVQSTGQQLPAFDTSWVPTGADWALNLKTGQAYGINGPIYGFYPVIAANSGQTRASVGWGVTANNSTGTLIEFGPNTARVTPGRGWAIEKAATNLFATPFAPATQTVTVSNATQYTVSVVGTGSLTLSGACTGSVVAGTPVTCTTSTTSLTATVSGTLLSMQVETGAVATTPISGTRSAEEAGFPSTGSPGNVITTFSATAGTFVFTIEKTPPNVSVTLAAFGANYLNQASTSTINNNRTATLTATCGAGANGHTVSGITWDATGRGLDCNGGTIATDANATGASAQQVYVGGQGSGGGDSTLNSYVQMITHYPIRLTGATSPTFQQATTP